MTPTVSQLPGLQESRTSGALVRLYCHGDDPVLRVAQGSLGFRGRHNDPVGDACVTAVSTSKALGAAAGTFNVTVKVPTAMGETHASFLQRVVDDDWMDVAFTVNGETFHVMRGLVDTVKEVKAASGDGAQSRTYTITGKDFGTIFEKSPIWFNVHTDSLPALYALKLLGARGVAGTPDVAVKKLLLGFMEIIKELRGTSWLMPRSMPPSKPAADIMGPLATDCFAGQVVFDSSGFDQEPARTAASMQLMDPSGKNVWALAQEWSDPMFCELFTDLVAPEKSEGSFGFDDTQMRITFRTRAFPVNSAAGGDKKWRALPMTVVPPQWVTSRDIGRGGTERFNAFCVSPQVVANLNRRDLSAPLWDEESIRQHGLRLFYVESKYIAAENNLVTMAKSSRDTVRDWHVLNPYLFNGSVTLGALAPGIRVGTRFRISGGRETQQETYYVEQVSHSWSASGGGRTTLGLTRGWIGTDASYQATLDAMAERYVSATSGNTVSGMNGPPRNPAWAGPTTEYMKKLQEAMETLNPDRALTQEAVTRIAAGVKRNTE